MTYCNTFAGNKDEQKLLISEDSMDSLTAEALGLNKKLLPVTTHTCVSESTTLALLKQSYAHTHTHALPAQCQSQIHVISIYLLNTCQPRKGNAFNKVSRRQLRNLTCLTFCFNSKKISSQRESFKRQVSRDPLEQTQDAPPFICLEEGKNKLKKPPPPKKKPRQLFWIDFLLQTYVPVSYIFMANPPQKNKPDKLLKINRHTHTHIYILYYLYIYIQIQKIITCGSHNWKVTNLLGLAVAATLC